MSTVKVSLKNNPYNIVIGTGNLSEIGPACKSLKLGADAIIITSSVINKLHGKRVIDSLKRNGFAVKVLEVPDGEQSKSVKTAFTLLEKLAHYDVMKKVFIVALGGGVIGDLSGFVAAIYKRGIPYIQIPTTFLAQIDSAIGGKTAVDLPVGKNLVGAFYQPKLVFTDVTVLKTLSVRQIRNGLAEAVKYGVIYDQKLFNYIEKNVKTLVAGDISVLAHVVLSSSQIKTAVVLADEKETKGIRTILNFGHTIGHAIEAAGKYHLYHHGEAIALGMRVAAHISCQLKMFKVNDSLRLNNLLSKIGLPQKIREIKVADILRIMRHDKKFIAGKNRFVLATQIGKVKVVEGISLPVIEKAINAYR